jgi:ribosome-associated translation inhibitor RaiA
VAASTVEQRLRIVPQFRPEEYERYTAAIAQKLDRRLSRWDAEQVELELSVKERDTASQKVVLECWISGVPKLVGTSTERDLGAAVHEVRDDVFRQIDRHVTRTTDRRRR